MNTVQNTQRVIEIPVGTQIQRTSDGANAKLTRPLRIQATGQKIGGVTMFYTFTLKSGAVYRVPAQYVSVMTSEA